MIIKIKNKLRKFVDIRVERILENQKLLQQTNFSYNQISQLFNEGTFIPFSVWTISPNTILHVLNDIIINKRNSVIEFGGGASTFYIAKLIQNHQLDTKLYSVESDSDWAEELVKQLKVLKLDHIVNIIHAPIKTVPNNLSFRGQKNWYDVSVLEARLDNKAKFDLILVDGPAGSNTPFSRYTAIPFLKKSMNSDFSIFLDDIHRSDETIIAQEWKKELDCESAIIDRYVHLSSTFKFNAKPFQLG